MKDKKVPELKVKAVKDLAGRIKGAKTLMILSIKSLPSKQFQEIKKSIRDHALVQVAKKNIMLRAIKEVGKESILSLNNHIKENSAFAISDIEGYELAGILNKKKTPVFARTGQIASSDIEVQGGPTNLPPGPAISELGALGIQVAVEEGKLFIKASKIVVKEGQTISEGAASILQKLNIQPFSVGLEPLVIYDIENEKIYTDIEVDSEKAKGELINSAGKALGFAQKILYYCKETIGYLLVKANSEEKSLSNLMSKEMPEKPSEENKEGDKDEAKEENKEEIKEESDVENKEEMEKKPEEENKEKDNTQLNNQEDK